MLFSVVKVTQNYVTDMCYSQCCLTQGHVQHVVEGFTTVFSNELLWLFAQVFHSMVYDDGLNNFCITKHYIMMTVHCRPVLSDVVKYRTLLW